MAVNYEDERFKQVNAEKDQALNKVNDTYNNMINNSDQFYNDLRNATNEWGEQQKQLQQEQTDFTIDTINQQKEWAQKDYEKEQRGAYSDYQKTTNQYGVLAENMANQGMSNTGYAETTLRGVYNTYQNRLATARDSFNRAVVNYDNNIKEAMLSNNSKLAEISYNTLKDSLTYALQGFQYKNDLIEKQLQMYNNTEDRYYSRWKDVLNQINTENELEERKREFDQQMALQWASHYSSSGGGGGDYSISGGEGEAIDTQSDAKKYGTFSNGYQPKGVGNHGTLTKTGRTAVAGNGKTQNVWQAEDGSYWFWDGNTRTYVPFASFYDTQKAGNKKTASTSNGAQLQKTSIPGVSKITNAGTPLDKGLRKLDLRENADLIQSNSSAISTFRQSKNWKTKTINGKFYEGLEVNGKFYACFDGNKFYEVK